MDQSIPRHSGARRSREPGIRLHFIWNADSGFRALRGAGMTAILMLVSSFATNAEARLDLSRASVERLDNGLTLVLLEDRTFPVVSIQTVYGTGARNDPAGRLGLAHFFEHMAFRGSKNFPDTGLVSEIYAAGGEWHGYTWLDLTTYFATTPKEDLNLLLDIEADRMARLDIRKDDVEAERSAVLAEMSGYANDPDSTLFDALMSAHFLTHPYRNNTIGYKKDVNAISHADLEDFYRRHYSPQNAVIAIVGDFNRAEVAAAVARKFGKIKKLAQSRAPLTAETPRTGERRIRLTLPSDEKLFKIAYPAPAASHPDFAAFLLLQVAIGGADGINFNQNEWGKRVPRGSPIHHAGKNIRTFFIPTAESYAFVISGATHDRADEEWTENEIQAAFDRMAQGRFVHEPLIDPTAKAQMNEQWLAFLKPILSGILAFDVETTEDAAHQLAYFAGIGALDQFLSLDKKIEAVTADDIARVAANYLRKNKRTIAWLEPGPPLAEDAAQTANDASFRNGASGSNDEADAPVKINTPAGSPILFQRSALSPTVAVTAVLGGRYECSRCALDFPALGLTSISLSAVADKADDLFAIVAREVRNAEPIETTAASSGDPMARLDEIFASKLSAPKHSRLLAIAVSGDITEKAARHFTDEAPAAEPAPSGAFEIGEDAEFILDGPKAQHAVGYAAAAPAADSDDALATRIALYILSHGYGGRLGEEAISRRGLAYYIDAQYRAGIGGGLVTLATGVDPEKVDAFRALMKAEISRLKSDPPTDAEIAEARRHLLGRKISAAQSNEEIADALIRDFLAVGRPESPEEFAARLNKVTREDVLNAVKALQNGAVVTVRGGGVD